MSEIERKLKQISNSADRDVQSITSDIEEYSKQIARAYNSLQAAKQLALDAKRIYEDETKKNQQGADS